MRGSPPGSQSYVDQVAQLERAGAVRIFREKESGARSDRPQLAKAIASLDEGDVLLVTRTQLLRAARRSKPG
jgi:DNA invertase Pin-like site-specific DNA recombinase